MNANELRLGNKVNVYFRNQTQEIEIEKIEKNYINNFDIKSIKPIPITEEWLLKFRFKHSGYGFFIHLKNRFEIEFNRNENTFTLNFITGELIEYKYVHQLQNLYFVLTGEELKIK